MQKILINNREYAIEKDDDKIFDYTEMNDKITDYFYDYDYIFGDMSYNKMRLKGFYKSDSKKCTNINDIKFLEDYNSNYCAVGCKWFLIKKMQ